MHPVEAEIRAKCAAEKKKIRLEIDAERWVKIDFAQVCRNLDAQMNADVRYIRPL